MELTPQQQSSQAEFRRFASTKITPRADCFDREERLPMELVREIAGQGYLGSFLKPDWGGRGMDMITYGLLTEEIGRACSSVRSLLTVHDMVALAISKWGSRQQRESWLVKLARAETLGALAVSEPNIGSDAKGVETRAKKQNGFYTLNGKKKWITFGQIATLYLVLVNCDNRPTAFLVERDRPGLSVKPITGMLGVRASMLAELSFENCEVPKENMIGGEGFGLVSVIATALNLGRYSVACGCVGIAQACLESCLHYTSRRKQFGVYLREHQLIKRLLTDMVVNVKAARLLCYQAGYFKDVGDPGEVAETLAAKYFASQVAMKVAIDSVQIHGANGCSSEYPVQRYMRDAKVMEIIEGSSQIQQLTIADCAFQEKECQQEAAAVN